MPSLNLYFEFSPQNHNLYMVLLTYLHSMSLCHLLRQQKFRRGSFQGKRQLAWWPLFHTLLCLQGSLSGGLCPLTSLPHSYFKPKNITGNYFSPQGTLGSVIKSFSSLISTGV